MSSSSTKAAAVLGCIFGRGFIQLGRVRGGPFRNSTRGPRRPHAVQRSFAAVLYWRRNSSSASRPHRHMTFAHRFRRVPGITTIP
jgi:hypothetical protein